MNQGLFQKVAERAAGRCEYCQALAAYSSSPFVLEHILPISKGGSSELENLAFSCGGCNNHKYNFTEAIDPSTGQTAPLFNPRKDEWAVHFFWSDDFQKVIGQTAVGRATVSRLRLNRSEVLNLRRVMWLIGEHPK